ncbi:MAG: hypothetical protein M9918_10840 [Anaerolineae bacterium]|nr:hypothetical protein [Anaerolineae bacterium]
MKHKITYTFVILFAMLITSFALVMTTVAASTDQSLPPRPPTATPSAASPASSTMGQFIELHLDPPLQSLWTEVQWLHPETHEWLPVDGWRGSPTTEDIVLWYVGEENLGRGPFRWLVYDSEGGSVLATSTTFYLPASIGQTVVVEVSIP